MKNYFLLAVLVIFVSSNLSFADDRNQNSNGNNSSTNSLAPDSKASNQKSVNLSQQIELDKQLKLAIESGNTNLEMQIRSQINAISPADQLDPKYLSEEYRDEIITSSNNPPYSPDWMSNDVLIYSGDIGVAGAGHDRIDIKMGKDGWLYAGLIRSPGGGTNGRIDVLRSENGGLNWAFVSAIQSVAAYFGQISLSVDVRGTNLDSTRITVYYSRSLNSNFNDATINWVSITRNGTGFMGGITVLSPTAGNKLLYPTAVSDGQYWGSATWHNVVCGEYNNAGTQMVSLRNARTTDWGVNYTSQSIIDGYPTWSDWFPKAAFKRGTTDSIYIAVERRFAVDGPYIRIIATTQAPSTGFYRHQLISSPPDVYTKPSITIQQNALSLPKKILVAYIFNGQARYLDSEDGGASWEFNLNFSNISETNVSYVNVSSDSSSAGGGYFIGCFQKVGGDTIVVRRGIIGNLGARVVKPNEFISSIYNSPKVAIYNSNGTKYSALLYTGILSNFTNNVYFDQENLPTNVEPIGNNLAESYTLSQNFPNPFNPETNINFGIPAQGMVKLVVYDILGKEVATLVNKQMQPGNYSLTFNADKLTSGVYFYKLTSGEFSDVKRMVLLK